MRRRVSNTAWGIVCLMAMSSVARATSEKEKAERLFVEGQALLREGKLGEACELLAESQRLDPALGTLLNLAVCHEQQGKLATASREYKLVIEWARDRGDAARDRLQFAEEKARSLEARVPKLKIVLEEPSPGLVVNLDARPLPAGEIDRWLEVDPGTHRVEVTRNGQKLWSRSDLRISAGESRTERVPPLAAAVASAQKTRDPWPYVIGGVGGGAVVAGIVLLVRAETYDDRSNEKTRLYYATSPRDPALASSALEDYDSALQSQRIGLIVGAIGLVGLGTATILLLVQPGKKQAASRAGLALSPRAGGAALSFEGSF